MKQTMNRKEKRRFAIATLGCVLLLVFLFIIIPTALFLPFNVVQTTSTEDKIDLDQTQPSRSNTEQITIPTLTPAPTTRLQLISSAEQIHEQALNGKAGTFTELYKRINPGVVNIQIYGQDGQSMSRGAGSGFILDREGHIITNNHVIARAGYITVIFFNNIERQAKVVGADDDSDLAVIQVKELVQGAEPLPLGNSDEVTVGEWVVAIGNPFGQQGSMSIGIVSAIGRTIPSGATPFAITEAIQTDAAINPGNSGGPLLNVRGEVIGVNAQIATGSAQVNSGVGFAIPINIVRRIAPVLIKNGLYQWPWLGIQGGSVNLAIMEVNHLETQRGAYIDSIIPGGPADEAGLQGTSRVKPFNGLQVPVGGDIVIAADDTIIDDFNDLLAQVARKNLGETMELTILRDGQEQQVTLNLTPRPAGSNTTLDR